MDSLPSPWCTYRFASPYLCLSDLSPLNFKHVSAFFFSFPLTVSAVFKDLIAEVPLWI